MSLTPTIAALLASRALDGELGPGDDVALADARAASPAADALARRVEAAHRQLAALRAAAPRAIAAPAAWAEQVYAALHETLASLPRTRRRRPEVSGRDAAHAEDLELAQAALAGDEQAQREIYFGHIALVQHLLQARRLAAYRDDIAQDVFFRVFSRLHTFRGDSSLRTWIHRVALNHINNVLTRDMPKRARELSESQLEVPEGGVSVIEAAVDAGALQDARLETAERRAIIDAALLRLPGAARTVVMMKEIDGLTCEEIATVLAVPMGTVQSRLARGRVRLAEFLVQDPRAGSAR
ncbi:MAG: sigma-70 family RNA polymerase sigma factor [Gemmatimonadaceae bacterium]|nr:sigma-70 family RNA polymerase sigma factor [Gemmatimonadaceae bacterium]